MSSPDPPSRPADPPEHAQTPSGLVRMEITRIRAYERNPRRCDNPEYERIKDSICAHGMDQPLTITQRPGESGYLVHSGGNTRLRVLRELFEETGDEQFGRIHCLIVPWTCESDVLLAHLRENDLRGSLTFIDKALAVQEAGKLLAQELGVEAVTQDQLETELQEAGYRIHQGLISRMAYAVYRLLPLMPQALEAGLGRPQVGKIRSLERAARNLWLRFCQGEDATFDPVFEALCSRYDGPVWETDILQGAIETEIAEEAELSIHSVRVALDAALAGREVELPAIEPDPGPESPTDHGVHEGGEVEQPAVTERAAPQVPGNDAQEPRKGVGDQRTAPGGAPPVPGLSRAPGETGLRDLKSLRARAWTLAARLAQRNGIGDLVVPLPGKGLGFVLRDVPDPALAEQLDDESLGQVSMLWWQLAACAEMTFAPLDAIVPELPDESILRHALEEQDAGLLFKSVWTLDPGQTGYRLWRTLHERDCQDLVHLMDTYRHIRHLAAQGGTSLWEKPPQSGRNDHEQ
ncbi:MAG: chromosome partitioning protein ParB [Gammaproteobacteria bacterium]|nr:chromosome partitioning protein ParB [Gammaproteobacteria bacterium]